MPRACFLAAIAFLFHVGCTGTPTKPAPTSSGKPKDDGQLAFISISKKAYERAQIKTAKASLQEVHEHIPLTGWIMAKPGHEVTLTAPVAGYVHFRKKIAVPIPGDTVSANQELLELEPVLSPVEQIQVASLKRDIESDLVKANTTLTTAQSDFERVDSLYKQKLRSEQEFEKVKQARDHAREELKAAQDKLTFFSMSNVTVRSPQRGKVLQLFVGSGQYVPASAPLVTIIDLNPIWVRVPIPEFDLPTVDPKQTVAVAWKNQNHDREGKPAFFTARPTGRVAQVDPVRHTADIWYELEALKEADRFVKDQMVTVQVPIGKKQQATVVPYSAIVFDSHGSSWVYIELGFDKASKHQFERRRVEMVTSVDSGLIVRPSLSDGELLVTDGAAKLFSAQFFKTPLNIPGEED